MHSHLLQMGRSTSGAPKVLRNRSDILYGLADLSSYHLNIRRQMEAASQNGSAPKRYPITVFRRYQNLNVFVKLAIWFLLFFHICLAALIITVGPAQVPQYLYDKAKIFSETKWGWLYLGIAMSITSLPPLVGYTTLTSVCGFAYGFTKGFLISAIASLLGSALVFVVLRYIFRERIQQWAEQNKKWQALEAVIKAKGLPLIILIRISPFPPWVYANAFFASIETVSLWQFAFATCFTFPKLALNAFIGARMAALADGKQRDQMDTLAKVLDGILVGGGVVVAIFAGWLMYGLVQNHIRNLNGPPSEVDEFAAEAVEHYDEETPLMQSDGNRP
ncbi:hypothetical protein NP233_g2150 [Leucocoprinus birnbaumii]|uniref:Golgi apparatus membrane protein TVP38 n=1 Tax=Leucocoprinus birnbaumii TaxID=56174 RepID=A0AAD5YXG3_9AGAR|nr:hypothetical protein NP233_g2150 [Leucocoprinus birnbaumii]